MGGTLGGGGASALCLRSGEGGWTGGGGSARAPPPPPPLLLAGLLGEGRPGAAPARLGGSGLGALRPRGRCRGVAVPRRAPARLWVGVPLVLRGRSEVEILVNLRAACLQLHRPSKDLAASFVSCLKSPLSWQEDRQR